MAVEGTKIPAWRRLGLTLKNENHSGLAVNDPGTLRGHLQSTKPYDGLNGSQNDMHSSQEPAVNGQSSRLGKRKHLNDAAEDESQAAKRGRTAATETISAGNTATAPDTTRLDAATVEKAAAASAASGDARPKGDPNYRKKKVKINNPKRRNHEEAEQGVHHERSSLSPGAPKQQTTLLASTETDHEIVAPAATPQKPNRSSSKETSGSSSGAERRKSVAFTPDTKKSDGNSAQNLFKKWVAEQKASAGDAAGSTPRSLITEDVPKTKSIERAQKKIESPSPDSQLNPAGSQSQKVVENATTIISAANSETDLSTAASKSATKGKRKDPSLYTSYLTQYHTDRANWKFNKAKQNDVINNALNIFRIPQEHSDALLEYVQGLKGAGVIERLKADCEATLKALAKEDALDPESMDDPAARQAVHDEALQKRLQKEQKRRKTDGDVEALGTHPHGEGFIRRLKRERAEALLRAVGRAAPVLPAASAGLPHSSTDLAPRARDSKKRKRRIEISSDESSSDSSEDDSSSNDSISGESSDDSGSVSDAGQPMRKVARGDDSTCSDDSDPSSDEDNDSDSDSSDSDSDSGSESGQSEDDDEDSDSD